LERLIRSRQGSFHGGQAMKIKTNVKAGGITATGAD
jgi:hypothetical protein